MYFAVIGRVPGDQEDFVGLYHAKTPQDACDKFEEEMHAELDLDALEQIKAKFGKTLIISNVLVSESMIRESQ